MAVGFFFAEAPDADRLEKGRGRQKFDDLPTFRHLHLAFVVAAENGETDLVMFILRKELGSGSKQGDSQIEVISTLPVFTPDTARRITRRAYAKAFVRTSC